MHLSRARHARVALFLHSATVVKSADACRPTSACGLDVDVGSAILKGLALALVLIGLCMAFVAAGPA
jgi:hypothetical protein